MDEVTAEQAAHLLGKVRSRIAELDAESAEWRGKRAALVRFLRENGMTLDQIAAAAGVTRQTVHQWSRVSPRGVAADQP